MVTLQTDDRTALLHGSTLFSDLPQAQLTALAEQLRRRRFRRGEVLFHRDDPASALYLIQEGAVKIHLSSEDGDETVLALLGPGSCVGEIAVLDGGPRSATATAVEPVEAYTLLRDDLLAFVRENPDVALGLLTTIAARLRRTNEWLEDAYVLDLDQRLARRLREFAEEYGRPTSEGIEVPFPLTQSELAGMLGATRVTINRQLGILQDAGILRLGKGSFTVIDSEALRRRAGR
ncbi:MAG: Crp/Fnr family transcriptional regulator [Dehalococcoidia bacterium]